MIFIRDLAGRIPTNVDVEERSFFQNSHSNRGNRHLKFENFVGKFENGTYFPPISVSGVLRATLLMRHVFEYFLVGTSWRVSFIRRLSFVGASLE